MHKFLVILVGVSLFSIESFSQFNPNKFGKGLQFTGKDSSYYLKAGFRFQNLFVGDWTIVDGKLENPQANFLVRRARLKFDGWAYSPKLKYKFELGLTNRDISGGSSDEFRNTANVILDAWVAYNFYKGFTIQLGQAKLPGNRERLISSGSLQFVDRSQLNSRFTIDRGMGVMLKHNFNPFGDFIVREIFSLSQGEGRNVTAGDLNGLEYTLKLELLPFGKFASKGDYVGAAIKSEDKPKLAIAFAYDINDNAVRERGLLGNFIIDSSGNYVGATLQTFFADFMFKHKSFSFMGEFAWRDTKDGNPLAVDNNGNEIGTFYTGNAINLQAGYMLPKNWELAVRYTDVNPDVEAASEENHYTLALSKYIVGHKLKAQTDFTFLDKETSNDRFLWRTQIEFHF